jgi:hypothetical protein
MGARGVSPLRTLPTPVVRNACHKWQQRIKSIIGEALRPLRYNWLKKYGNSFTLLVIAPNQPHTGNNSLFFAVTIYIGVLLVFTFVLAVQRWKQFNSHGQQTFNEGKCMTTFPKEAFDKDFISEKFLEGQLEEIKEQLEKISSCESINSILAEEFCEVENIINQPNFTTDSAIKVGEIFGRMASSMVDFAVRHKAKMSKEAYESLKTKASNLKSGGKLLQTAALPIPYLKTKDSLNNLKKWHELLETYVEVIDGCLNIPPKSQTHLEKLSSHAITVTDAPYPANPKKEKYRRLIRNSAAFILQWLQRFKSQEIKDFAIGSTDSSTLLEETKNRLHY